MSESLKVICSMATRQILGDLILVYKQRTEVEVELVSMGGVDAAKAVRNGCNADVVVLASAAMEKLEGEGHLVADTRRNFALSGIAIAVRSGDPHFMIENASDIKQAVMKGGRFCLSTGPSGDHFKKLLDQWGLSEALSSRVIQAPAGMPVAEILARGNADIGVQQLSELLACPGIDILGLLPTDIQATTVFTAGVSAASSQMASALDLIAFLVSPETEKVKQGHGMEAPLALGSPRLDRSG